MFAFVVVLLVAVGGELLAMLPWVARPPHVVWVRDACRPLRVRAHHVLGRPRSHWIVAQGTAIPRR
jgi:hypothetical protein